MPASSHFSDFDSDSPRLSDASVADLPTDPRLRGLRWRVLLGVLPPCPAPIETLRRAAANGRRRYAEFRRRHIVDPHAMEDMQKAENLSVNNPLSQDPDSIWGRYFRNAELERIIEKDLTRLYPEDGSFFQSFPCQIMLRRILLVWALVHPQYGYRQGMHELLAPLVYVLHMDIIHLSHVRQRYEDPFENRFDTLVEENNVYNREGKQAGPNISSRAALRSSNDRIFTDDDDDWVQKVHPEDLALVEPDDFGFNLKTMVLGSDSYGAEGELGALLSGRFMEHDAYCMLDSLLSGQNGEVMLADYFTSLNEGSTGLSPVLEASSAIYNTLAAVDLPLYIHLVGLGVEPQFFALRWLRVLFGREFDLEKLLLLWDAIFAAPNLSTSTESMKQNKDVSISSPRASFIFNFAASMMLYLRPTLLAAPNATICLQKLLNFPKNSDVRNLIENAKMLQTLSEEPHKTPPSPRVKNLHIFERIRGKKNKHQSHSPSFQSHVPASSKIFQHRNIGSPEMIRPLPESYWEERWINSIRPEVEPDGMPSVNVDLASGGSESNNVSGVNDEIDEASAETPKEYVTDPVLPTHVTIPNLLTDDATKADAKYTTDATYEEVDKKEETILECVQTEKKNICTCGAQDSTEANEGRTFAYINDGSGSRYDAKMCTCDAEPNAFGDDTIEGLGNNNRSQKDLSVSDHVKEANAGVISGASLQNLGYSMVESIQVLESFLCSLGNDGAPKPCREGMIGNGSSEALLNGKGGQSGALAALSELRKIGNILLHM